MKRIIGFFKKEAVLVIAAFAAVLSAIFVPPSIRYTDYIDWQVLVLLFCLMAVVAGFKKTGAFSRLSQILLSKTNKVRSLAMILVLSCFFFSMFITNDVALITFVPLTIGLLGKDKENRLIFIVVMETVASNLGSLVTPIGNPQNLYLYSFYDYDIGSFLAITLPLGICCLALIVLTMLFMRGNAVVVPQDSKKVGVDRIHSLKFLLLFILCLLVVLKILDFRICLLIVIVTLLFSDRGIFGKVDYALLLTFISFFVFVGNISRIGAVRDIVSSLLTGRELLVSVVISQVISNVPAAVMLSSFSSNAGAIVLGTNIGGLGTLIASLASLISYRLYCAAPNARKGRFLLIFSIVNIGFLAATLLFARLFLSGH